MQLPAGALMTGALLHCFTACQQLRHFFVCLPTEIRNTITSFSLSTDKTGFLGLPPAKKWVLYGETGSGLGRPQSVHSTSLAAGVILCSPLISNIKGASVKPGHTCCSAAWGCGCLEHTVLKSEVAVTVHALCNKAAILLTEVAAHPCVHPQHDLCMGQRHGLTRFA